MEVKRKPNAGGSDEKKSETSPILSLLRQYLTKLSPDVPKTKGRSSRSAKGKLFVKQLKVKVGPAKKRVPKTGKVRPVSPAKKRVETKESTIAPQIERSLQEYIARRSAMLNRPAKGKGEENITRTIVVNGNAAGASGGAYLGGEDLSPIGKLSSIPGVGQGNGTGPAAAVPLDERIPVAGTAVPSAPLSIDAPAAPREINVPTTIYSPVVQSKAERIVNPAQAPAAPAKRFGGLFKNFSLFGGNTVQEADRRSFIRTDIEAKEDARKFAERLYEAEKKQKAKSSSTSSITPVAPQTGTAPASQMPAAAASSTDANASTLLKYLPFFSKTILDTAKRTEVLETTLQKTQEDAKKLGEKLQQAEQKITVQVVQAPAGATIKAPDATIAVTQKKEPELPTTPEKPAELNRKQVLENEEKRAEVLMMRSAKQIKPKKSGFFAQISASLEYMGMGKQRLLIIQNLGTMLNAGLPLVEALHTLQLESKNKATKKLLRKIITAVDNGSPLWRAMAEQNFFSPHAIALVRIGEEAGNLAQNMIYLAEQQEKDQALREKVKMAMIYPSIVLTLMFIIVMGLGLFVLPQLLGVLKNLNAKLPFVTVLLITFTDLFTTYAYIAIPGFLLFVLMIVLLAKFTRFKIFTQWLTFKIPGIGKLARQATLARFGVILGGLLKAGVPLVEALTSLVDVTPIVSYKNFYKKLLDHVNGGDSFARSFTVIRGTNALLPLSMQQLIITGEKTGTLADIMMKLSEMYEKEANNTAQKLPVILEPMILLGIGALVGTIAFAIIVPIYSIVGNVNNGG